MDELIHRLKNTAFDISAITIDTDGSVHRNEKLTWKDTEEIINYLNRYYEISKIVDEFNATRDSSPMVERTYAEYTKIEKVECFDQILDLFKE